MKFEFISSFKAHTLDRHHLQPVPNLQKFFGMFKCAFLECTILKIRNCLQIDQTHAPLKQEVHVRGLLCETRCQSEQSDHQLLSL